MTRAPRKSTAERTQQVLNALAAGSLTEAQIALQIGVKPLSAFRLVRALLDEGRIRIAGKLERDNVRGTKPLLYGLAEDRQSRYAAERGPA